MINKDDLTITDKINTYAHKIDVYAYVLCSLKKELTKAPLSKESKLRGTLESARELALPIYKEALILAHELYSSWPKAKQIRAGRQMQAAMTNAKVFDYDQGGITYTVDDIKKGEDVNGVTDDSVVVFPYALRELVRENDNFDNKDQYWEIIKGAFAISKGGNYGGLLSFLKENGEGEFERIRWHELFGHSDVKNCKPLFSIDEYKEMGVLHWREPFMEESMEKLRCEPKVFTRYIIDQLIGNKVFFFPLTCKDELFDHIPPSALRGYEPIFAILDPYHKMKGIGLPKAEKVQLFEPFKKNDAENTKSLLEILERKEASFGYGKIEVVANG